MLFHHFPFYKNPYTVIAYISKIVSFRNKIIIIPKCFIYRFFTNFRFIYFVLTSHSTHTTLSCPNPYDFFCKFTFLNKQNFKKFWQQNFVRRFQISYFLGDWTNSFIAKALDFFKNILKQVKTFLKINMNS